MIFSLSTTRISAGEELTSIERYFEYFYEGTRNRSLSEYNENFKNRNWREYNISDHQKYDLGTKILKEYY